MRANRCGHLDYQGAIRTGIEPALSEYKSAVYQNEPSIAVDTFIYFFKAPFSGGIRTHALSLRESIYRRFIICDDRRCSRLYNKMLDCTVLQSAGGLKERISLVQKKRLDKRYCCKHLFDEFDPKHHVQRYVRDPQATPHSISKACKNKEQCIAVCALHLNAV